MASQLLSLTIVTLFFSLSLCGCDNLCAVCSADGNTCLECKRGYQTQNGGFCQLSGTAGIIAGSILGGALLFALVIVGLCVCINGWKKVFRYPFEDTHSFNPYAYETQQQIYPMTFEPAHVSNIPIQSILRNGSQTQGRPVLGQIQQTQVQKPSNQSSCVICMNPGVNVRILPCNHFSHIGCLANWFNKRPSCPQCQTETSEVKVQCSGCGAYNDSVSFCPPGCKNPNHQQCFLHLNSNRLKCKNCDKMRRSSRISNRRVESTVRGNILKPNLQYINGGTITNLNNMPTLATLPSTYREIHFK